MNYNKIFWKRGLDITPEILIESDNYNTQQCNIIRKISTLQSYGILPETKFLVEPIIMNDILSIRNLNCSAITSQGYLIDIKNHISFKDIKLYECTNEDHYVILKVYPYNIELVDNSLPYAQPKYDVEIKETRNAIDDGIPILKICRRNKCWEIDWDYIPPSVSLCSHKKLIRKFEEIVNIINTISKKLADDEFISLQLRLLELELQNYSLFEFPFELVNALKKIMAIIELYFQKRLNRDELIQAKEFIEKKYNHNEIVIFLTLCMDCLETIKQKLEEEPVPEMEPEPEPEVVKPVKIEEELLDMI